MNLDEGKSISLELDQEKHQKVLTPIKKPVAISGVDKNFAHQVNEFISHYRTALEELAK